MPACNVRAPFAAASASRGDDMSDNIPELRPERLRLASQDRFARHRLIEGFSQDIVASTRVAVVGAGALGNELVKNLLLMGIGAIDVYDFDTVELSNLTRSVFLRESDIGMNKAEALVDRARELHPATQMRALPGPISRSLPLSRLAEYDMLIAAVDNMEARLRLNEMALLSGSDWMNLAIDARSAVTEIFPFHIHDTACYACSLPGSVFERIAARYSCGGLQRASQVERKVPTTTITASSAAALACAELLRYLHQRQKLEGLLPERPLFGGYRADSAQRVYLDTVTPAASRSFLRKASALRGCPGCGMHQRAEHLSTAHGGAAALLEVLRQSDAAQGSGTHFLKFSDPLILSCRCRECNASSLTSAALKAYQQRRAADHDERMLKCPHCEQLAIEPDIRDSMSLDDYVVHFGKTLPDCAWISLGAHCFDLLATT